MIIKRIFRTALSMILALSMMTAGMASRTVNAAAEESRENSGGVVTDDVSDVSSAQYAYATDGSHYLDFDAGIHVPNWNQDAGNMDQDVIVAVLDTGIDWRHPELADRIVTFTEEQQRILGCGAHGFDAIPDEKGDAMEDPDFYATEVLTHATHCAGIIGAAWDKKGISGAASRARLLNIRVTNEDGMLSTTAVLRAFSFIKEAYKLGIKTRIASCSWYIGENSRAVDTAVRDLGENCGILTFFAAGNEGIDVNDYGSTTTMAQSNPYAVLVGATNIKAVKPNFSSYSRTGVDVMAPGTAILSTIPLSGIDDEPAYFSDLAPKGTNLFYAGANSEGEIDIQMEGAPATVGITDEASFLGRTSYRISTADKLQPDDTFSLTLSAKGLKKPVDFEKGGYRLSLINMSKYETIMINTASVKNTSGGWSEAEDLGSASIRSSWMNEEFVLPADTDFDDFQMRLELYLLDVTEPSPVTFYLDSIGIGNQLSNYGIKTGTSMACPTAAGAAAVMLSSHLTQDMEYESGYDVMQLKADIIGPTRVIDGAEEYINSAGIVDLSVKKENYCPSISDVTINGNELKLSGYYFGDAQGSVSTELITAGVHKPIHTSIRSWTDREVVLDLNDTIAGRLQIALTAANGRKYTFLKQFDRSENVFEKEYDFPTGTDDPYAINSIQDGEASGAMFGLKGKLYFLQEVSCIFPVDKMNFMVIY